MSYREMLHQEFYYPGNSIGILLIHGFAGSPHDMHGIGEYLAQKGFTVKGVLLNGHGRTRHDMAQYGYKEWILSAVAAYRKLKEDCDRVYVVGFSMGGNLAMYLARNYNIEGFVSIAAPIKVNHSQVLYHVAAKELDVAVNGVRIANIHDPNCYHIVPLRCIRNLMILINKVESQLKGIDKPVLIMQSYGDKTVKPISANIIYNKIGSREKSIVYYHKSGHSLLSGRDKEQVFEEIYRFLARMSGCEAALHIKMDTGGENIKYSGLS